MSAPTFHAAAVARLDGGPADGVHLLFEPPVTAGFSIDGFDIERRDATREHRRRCVALTPDELAALEARLATGFELGRIELRTGAAPVALPVEGSTRRCVRIDRRRAARLGPNPVLLDGVELTVFTSAKRRAKMTALAPRGGLAGEQGIQIDLPGDVDDVELVLLATHGASVLAITAEGLVRLDVPVDKRAQTLVVPARGVRRVRIDIKEGELALSSVCWAPPVPPVVDACHVYDCTFSEERDDVRVTLNVPIVLAVALRAGGSVAVAGDPAEFAGRRVDRVLVYAAARASAIEVCVTERLGGWGGAKLIAANVNFPVRTVNGALGTVDDEAKLADTRLLAGERFDRGAFERAAGVLNAAADVAAPWATTLTRASTDETFTEVRSWAYATLPKLHAQWRRMLGLAHLDRGAGLTVGSAYDYRITGRFRRSDVSERLLGFHTVPVGAVLPETFALDDVLLSTPHPCTVALQPGPGAGDLEHTGRKRVLLEEDGGRCLRIELPAPVLRLALDVDPGHQLEYAAHTTGVFLGPPAVTFKDVVPATAHAVLDFGAPVDTVVLTGKGTLYGLRVGADPTLDPDEILTVTQELYGVVYESTPAPAPPTHVSAANLQVPATAADAAPWPLGFRVGWLPPGTSPAGWPPDLAAAPPLDVMSFTVERRRVDTGGAWRAIADDTAFFGARGSTPTPVVLFPGQDLLAAFPERRPPVPPVSPFMRTEDPLEGLDPGPGSTHQYQVCSVDAIGRVSAPGQSPVVRLEKHAPPPQPSGPVVPAGRLAPEGVAARVLQASDPALSDEERTLLAGAAAAVVIEWGWTDEQRARDPYVTEFRVYWESAPPDVIDGALTGVAAAGASGWTMAATLSRPVATDALAGRYVTAGARPFRVLANGAGTTIAVELARSAIDPSLAPSAGAFVFQPRLDGTELRPARWERRSALVPLTAAASYQHVFQEPVVLSAAQPRVRVWAGVSAADDQAYVADERSSATLNGGRPGNESSVVPAPAHARWIGQPAFTATQPLPDVPELRCDEPVGADVRAVVDLPALLTGATVPAGHRLVVERLALSEVSAAFRVTGDRIDLQPPDGAAVEYQLTDATDRAALLTQLRSGVPGTVERRFLMDALLAQADGFAGAWRPAVDGQVDLARTELVLSSQAERYALRVRIADAAGHVSAAAAVLGIVVRVPSLRVPAPPELTVAEDTSDALTVSARVRDVPDVRWLLFFSRPVNGAGAPAGELLRTANRPDLYPGDGVRLRLEDGTLLRPTVQAAATGTRERPDRIVAATLTPGYGQQLALWAATLTADGVPSRLAGPTVASTGPQPLVVPTLAVTATAGLDHAVWGVPAVPAEVALERSDGSGWRQVSPWLPPTVTAHDLPGAGTRRYRLALRADRERRATGPEVTPA